MTIFADLHAALFDGTDILAVTVAGRPSRGGQNNLHVDAVLCRADQRLLYSAIIHLLRLDQQAAVSAGNERSEGVARIDGADNEVGILELGIASIPVGGKNVANRLYILGIRVDDAILTVGHTTATTAAAKGRAGEIRGHDIGRIVYYHALLMG